MEKQNDVERQKQIEGLKATILEMREWGCNKVADLLCETLEELYNE